MFQRSLLSVVAALTLVVSGVSPAPVGAAPSPAFAGPATTGANNSPDPGGSRSGIVANDKNGRVVAVEARTEPLAAHRPGQSKAATAIEAARVAASTLAPGAPANSFVESKRKSVEANFAYVDQSVGGVPVFGAQLAIELDADGNAIGASGQAMGAARISARKLSAREAATFDEPKGMVSSSTPVIYDPNIFGETGEVVPAWNIAYSTTASGAGVRRIVSAVDGKRLKEIPVEHRAQNRTICEGGAARPAYVTVVFVIPIIVMKPCLFNAQYPTNDPLTYPQWTPLVARTEGQAPSAYQSVNALYTYLGQADAYMRTVFNRDGYDGAGARVVATVDGHIVCNSGCSPTAPTTPVPYPNAEWNSLWHEFVFGSGFETDDVVAHEYMHAVTEFTANLTYSGESGGLNESYSDMLGEVVDQANPSGNDAAAVKWLLGEDLPPDAQGNRAIRNMADPTTIARSSPSPDRYTSALATRSSDVHSLSGIGNKTFYLMANGGTFNGQSVGALGNDKAMSVAFRALTTVLTPASTYPQFGYALNKACAALQAGGTVTATDCANVTKATTATEITNPYRYTPIVSETVWDSRYGPGPIGPSWASADVAKTISLLPSGYSANDVRGVTADIVVVDAAGPGFLSISGRGPGVPTASTLNFDGPSPRSNSVMTAVSSDGTADIRVSGTTSANVAIRVTGVLTLPRSGAVGITSVAPKRLYDGTLASGASTTVNVAGLNGVPVGATAALVNLTNDASPSVGYLRTWPTGSTEPATSSHNIVPSRGPTATATWVRLSAGGSFNVRVVGTSSRVIVDLLAYSHSSGANIALLPAQQRVYDSRSATALAPGATRDVQFPMVAKAAIINLTLVQPASSTFLTVYQAGTNYPNTSNVNGLTGAVAANFAIVPLDSLGRITVRNNGGQAHFIVDLWGYVY